ncbi:hypothetical protein CRYPA_1414 [uncultured Candidatus Thioglobus sp.]|nr:hypothetical protein CRYPA_1414 [uncultured Candidatus Thioglobus sp.]
MGIFNQLDKDQKIEINLIRGISIAAITMARIDGEVDDSEVEAIKILVEI